MKKILTIAAFSISFQITFAQTPITPPHNTDFNSSTEFESGWKIENSNPSGDSQYQGFWIYSPDYFGQNGSGSVVFIPHVSNPSDDWFFTPAFYLETGKVYTVDFLYKSLFTGYSSNLSVFIGTDDTSSAMTTLIKDFGDYISEDFSQSSNQFSVNVTGVYYIGFHDYGTFGSYGGQTIENFSITGTASVIDLNNTKEVSCFPNPVAGTLFLKNLGKATIYIYNATGQQIKHLIKSEEVNEINLTDLPSGIYTLWIECGSKQFVRKIEKVR